MPRHPSLDNILPFTPADDARIQRTGKLVAVPKLKVPANLSGFDLTRLTTPTTLAWPPELPARDPRGHPSAPKYRPWKKAADSKVGIAGNYYSFKAGRSVPCHSALERRFLACAEFDPNIVEIRAQYGLWNRHEYLEYKRAGLRMPAKSKITLDFMVTFTDGVGYHYHAVNIKPYLLALKPPALKRLGNEFSLVDSWGDYSSGPDRAFYAEPDGGQLPAPVRKHAACRRHWGVSGPCHSTRRTHVTARGLGDRGLGNDECRGAFRLVSA